MAEMATTTDSETASAAALVGAGQTRAPGRRALADSAASAAVVCVQAAAQWLPERELLTGAKVLGYFFYYVVRFRRAVVEKRIAAALPHVAATERRRIARDSYVQLALTLLWFLRLPSMLPTALAGHAGIAEALIDCGDSSLERFRAEVFEAKRNAVVMTGHVGMWELLPAALSSPQCQQWIVYRPLHQRALDGIVTRIRRAPQRQLIPDKRCFGLLRDQLQRPSQPNAQLVGLVADHRASNPQARVQVAFLGQRTHFATGAARLHLSGIQSSSSSQVAPSSSLWFAALLHNRAFYESPASVNLKPFRLVLRQISPPQDTQDALVAGRAKDAQLQVASITQSYAMMLEEIVRQHPAQYLWMHDLWTDKPFRMDVS